MHRHSGESRNPGRVVICTVIPIFPSFRFSVIPVFPSFRRFSRHSGESRNLRAAMDSGFRRNDGSIPKPPEKKRCPASPTYPLRAASTPAICPGRGAGLRAVGRCNAPHPARTIPNPKIPQNPRPNGDTAPLPPPNPLHHNQSMSGGKAIRFRQSPKEGNGH